MMAADEGLRDIVRVFAQYGYRKTSMRDLAESLGISRQALYNRFSSKEDAFLWAARSLVAESREQCLAELAREGPVDERIIGAIHAWIGQYVDLLKSAPHSLEILAMVSDVSSEEADRATREIRAALAGALRTDKKNKRDSDDAEGLSLTLHMAAKGLLGYCASSSEYRKELERIVRALPL